MGDPDRARGLGTLEELPADQSAWQLGDLWSFASDEYDQLKTFQSLVNSYVQISDPPRPLCLAVFGPPGSGKSTAVKSMCKMLERQHKPMKFPLTEVNLTELSSTSDLIMFFRRVRLELDDRSVPLIFFDEFDAPLAWVPPG
ncbi:MAG: AAA family ATPase [Deltaproteobacteria bacterium]|nr:MAG: AAA family ATPase [Deltaproteobacteria bacterium]